MKKKDWGTGLLYVVTLAAAIIAWVALRRAGIFRLEGAPLTLTDLDQVGSFLSGVLTPVALAWTARGLMFQRRELDEAAAAAETARVEAIRRGEPSLSLGCISWPSTATSSSSAEFNLRNTGAPVRRVRVAYLVREREFANILAQGDKIENVDLKAPFGFRTWFPDGTGIDPNKHIAWFVVRAEREDMAVSQYVFVTDHNFKVTAHLARPAVKDMTLDGNLPPALQWPAEL